MGPADTERQCRARAAKFRRHGQRNFAAAITDRWTGRARNAPILKAWRRNRPPEMAAKCVRTRHQARFLAPSVCERAKSRRIGGGATMARLAQPHRALMTTMAEPPPWRQRRRRKSARQRYRSRRAWRPDGLDDRCQQPGLMRAQAIGG